MSTEKTYEQRKVDAQIALYAEFMPQSLAEANSKYDALGKTMVDLTWKMSAADFNSLSKDILLLLNDVEWPFSMSGVIVKFHNEFAKNAFDDVKITWHQIKQIQMAIQKINFKGIEKATMIQNVLKLTERMAIDISEYEINMQVMSEIINIKETEQTENLWSTATKAWAAENNITLPGSVRPIEEVEPVAVIDTTDYTK